MKPIRNSGDSPSPSLPAQCLPSGVVRAAQQSFCSGQMVQGWLKWVSWWISTRAMLGSRTIQASLGEPEREVQWGCWNPEDLGEPGKEATGSYRRAAGSVMEKGWRRWAVPVAGLYLLVLLQGLRARCYQGTMGNVDQHPRVASDRKTIQKWGTSPSLRKQTQPGGHTALELELHWNLNFTAPYLPLLSVSPGAGLVLPICGFPHSSVGKESACNAGDPSSISGLGRSTEEGMGYLLQYLWASLVAQLVKNPPAMRETWV